ncbi:MAG: FAD-dependent oxidoreductase [Candidatus Brocadiales bacterium]|nr:FAD-dependent oxidoreductase [Candidatus Bathyanammoxibius sp.]MCQ4574918.1 FAD-dependent oxidoreductase [Candidatus Bathyanammoxibius amoris]
MKPERELLIIGCGPAAITAAIYAARKRIDVQIVSKDVGGQVATTFGIENYPGFRYITGPELVEKLVEQMDQFDIEQHTGERVTELSRVNGNYVAVTESGKKFSARSAVIATGAHPRELGVEGEEKYRGKGVSYCATCDAPLFADATVAVVGGGNSALSAAFELSRIASKVYLISRRQWRADEAPLIEGVKASANIEPLIGYVIEQIVGEETVKGVTVKPREGNGGKRSLTVDGIFVEIGLRPNSSLARDLVAINDFGEIVVDCDTSTGVPGLFAAGDVTNVKDKQIVIAAGQGALAAMGVFEYLLKRR